MIDTKILDEIEDEFWKQWICANDRYEENKTKEAIQCLEVMVKKINSVIELMKKG